MSGLIGTVAGRTDGRAAGSIEDSFERIFVRAMQTQQSIDHIVLISEQGLVIAAKSRVRGKEQRLAALAPVLNDAGESVFNEVGLAPLAETMLLGAEGTAYVVRMKSSPAFLLIAAKGQVNLGLLRMVAADIEAQAGSLMQTMLR